MLCYTIVTEMILKQMRWNVRLVDISSIRLMIWTIKMAKQTRRHKYETWLEWPKKRVKRSRVEQEQEKWEKERKKYKPDF